MEEVPRRKKVGSKRRKGGSSTKGKKPVAGQKQIMDGRINVLKITDVPQSDFSSESINFSCYVQKEMSEWLMDSGCSKHVTSHIADFIEYMPFDSPGKAEIADKKELDILGVGTIAIHHEMMDGKKSNIMLSQVLFVPTTNGRFYSTTFATEKGVKHIRRKNVMMFILWTVQNLSLELARQPSGCSFLRQKSYRNKIPRQQYRC